MCPESITTIIGALPAVVNLLKKGIDLASGHKKKFVLEIEENYYEEEFPVLVAFARITNLSNETYSIDSIAIYINDLIKAEHRKINTVTKVPIVKQYVIDYDSDSVTTEDVEFNYPHPMAYCPRLLSNDTAYGLVLFDLREHKDVPIESLKISISLAGRKEKISHQLK